MQEQTETLRKILRRVEPTSDIRRMIATLASNPSAAELDEVREEMERLGLVRANSEVL